jgi:hypothetical protein
VRIRKILACQVGSRVLHPRYKSEARSSKIEPNFVPPPAARSQLYLDLDFLVTHHSALLHLLGEPPLTSARARQLPKLLLQSVTTPK